MPQEVRTPAEFSTAAPSAARIYDYLLGGKDNYAVDRAAAEQVLAVAPDQRRLARANRAFAMRGVRVLADAGIRQFIDLGTGTDSSYCPSCGVVCDCCGWVCGVVRCGK